MKTFVLLALALAAPALADPCDKAMTQTDMNQCHGDQANQSDAELNRVYRGLVAKWKDDQKAVALLRRSERDWIAYRTSECARQGYPTAGGSIQPMIISMCVKTLTDARVELLKNDLTCQEGDVTCLRPR